MHPQYTTVPYNEMEIWRVSAIARGGWVSLLAHPPLQGKCMRLQPKSIRELSRLQKQAARLQAKNVKHAAFAIYLAGILRQMGVTL